MKTLLEQLIEQEVAKALGEAKSKPGRPNVFWLVTTVSSNPRSAKTMEDLADGVLEGVSGISDNNRIVMHWLGMGRNAVLVMKANYVLADNRGEIEKVWYDDPRQLTRDNMAYLRRIFNAGDDDMGNRRILENLLRRIIKNMRKSGDKRMELLGARLDGGYIPSYQLVKPYENGEFQINSPEELASYLQSQTARVATEKGVRNFEEMEISEQKWLQYVNRAILESVETYASEGEWIVHRPYLSVPQGSKLLVAVPLTPNKMPPQVLQALKTGEKVRWPSDVKQIDGWVQSANTIKGVYDYGLDRIYDVKFIDMNKWKQIQSKLQMKHFSK